MNFDIQAPEKAIYKFNEVTSLTGVKPYVLRFWETEFTQIKPQLNESGQKIYRTEDIEFVQKIKKLLFEDKLSIPEARMELDKIAEGAQMFKEQYEPDTEEVQPPALDTIESRSQDLKAALEQIIEKNSRPLNDEEERVAYEEKAMEVANKVKADIRGQSHLADKDIVNLVTAKKKLSVLLGKIDVICEQHNW